MGGMVQLDTGQRQRTQWELTPSMSACLAEPHKGRPGYFSGRVRGAAMNKHSSQFPVERIKQERATSWHWLAVSDRDNHEIHILSSDLLMLLQGPDVQGWFSLCTEGSNRPLHGYHSISSQQLTEWVCAKCGGTCLQSKDLRGEEDEEFKASFSYEVGQPEIYKILS